MIKKGSFLLLALLVSLPACGPKKGQKADMGKKTKKMAQSDEFSSVNMALADEDDLEIDESMRSFFNDMQEFVSFAEEQGDFEVEAEVQKDEFAWVEADEEQLDTVYFAFDKSKVDADEREKVDTNADRVRKLLAQAKAEDPAAKVVVSGHSCASAGSAAYNMALSEKRAKEVCDQLVAKGIDRKDLQVVGRGNEMLVVKDGDRDEQWANRRVELHVVHS